MGAPASRKVVAVMGDEQGYNGWANHATWAVALHWDNDEGSYSMRCERVEELAEDAEDRDEHVELVADWLSDTTEEWWQDALEAARTNGGHEWARLLIGDLLPRGSDVDWREIAANWVDEGEWTYGDEDADDEEA